jgi:ATP-dependent Lon protease
MNLSKLSVDKELLSGANVKDNTNLNTINEKELYSDNEKLEEYNEYNLNFKNYIIKNIEELNIYIKDWYDFKIKKKKYMENVDNILNKCTYGQIDAKKQMKRIIGQWMNGTSKGQCFGLCGPPGVGKTTLCKNGLAKCLFDENGESRPFAFLPLGGATNGSILEGHHYTYLGSTWGKIVDILMETKCMNPIIYIDELDKISKTEHGKEIASILTHLTDQTQNKEFYDRYFTSIPIDLSQVLFIFSYNNKDDIDSILRDRIQEIPIKALSLQDKLVISQNYVIPEILTNVGFSNMEVVFTNEILINIINKYTHEPGVRKLNEILYDIIRDINLKKIEDSNDIIEYPIIINEKITDPILSNMLSVTHKKINDKPMVGQGTGLYALSSGTMGGITIIQVMKTLSDKKLCIEKLTGSLGDVMKESMNCSLTVAWNILPDDIKKEINECKDGFGLHIHCGDYQQKDGPSASLIQCIAIVSRLTNIPIRNDVAMTGEMDLQGKAKEIGGLHSKIMGAYEANVKKVLIPKDNEKDLDLILKKEEEEFIEMKKIKSLFNNTTLLDKIEVDNDILNYPSNDSLNHRIPIEHIPSFTNFYSFDENESNLNKKPTKKRLFHNEMEIIIINDIYEALEYTLVPNNLIFNKIL